MQAALAFQAFNSRNPLPCSFRCPSDTGAYGGTIQQNRTRAALPFPAAIFRSSEIELVAQNAQQAPVRTGMSHAPGAINIENYDLRHRTIICHQLRGNVRREEYVCEPVA